MSVTGQVAYLRIPGATTVLLREVQYRYRETGEHLARTSLGGAVALAEGWLGQARLMPHRPAAVRAPRSSFAGFRFPSEVIMLAMRWYLRYGLSYRDVEELLAERGIAVDHVTIY